MSEAFPQLQMSPLYGVCHYFLQIGYEIFFRGETAGIEYLPRSGGFVIAANHASLLDPPFIGCQVPRQLVFFARKTLWHGGISSWWLTSVGTIPVDRDGGQDVGALKRVLRALGDGQGTILFPEGTRTPDGLLQQPKPGVGFIACRTQVPVVPARIFGSFEAFGRSRRLPRLGQRVDIVFGPALPPAAYDTDPGSARYQRASENIMAAIARLQLPRTAIV